MPEVQRTFEGTGRRRMGTLRRRWADPDDPRAINPPTADTEPAETEPDAPAPGARDAATPSPLMVEFKPDAPTYGRAPLPGIPDPRAVAARLARNRH